MQVSSREITFGINDVKKQLYLTNNSQSVLIFKIRTTDINHLSANPARGYIQEKQTKTIQIVCTKVESRFDAKLQIASDLIDQKLSTFDSTWASVERKKQYSTTIILLSRKQPLQSIKQQSPQSSYQKMKREEMSEGDEDEEGDGESLSLSLGSESGLSKKGSNSNYNNIRNNINSNTSSNNTYNNNIHNTNSSNNTNNMQSNKQSIRQLPIITQSLASEHIMLKSITSPLKHFSSSSSSHSLSNPSIITNRLPNKQIKMSKTMHEQRSFYNSNNNNVLIHNSGHNYQQPSLTSSELSHLCYLQGQLLAQRQLSSRLKQQIRQHNQTQYQRNALLIQHAVNKSMLQVVNGYDTTWWWCVFILIAIVCFTVGVLIVKE